ncbi:MAG: oligosaccharide flippase family protein [Colwellia sp.]|nr:oligosaccharide flippase family protein [Colwellia sp.]
MLGKKVIVGSSIFALSKFTQRLIGLVSTLILARLLTPEDFGLVAICAIFIAFTTELSQSGNEEYIIQKQELKDSDLHTAWTFSFILRVVFFFLILIMAPTISDYFDKPELQLALSILSLTLIISGLQNPGLILLRRNINYKPIFWLNFSTKFLSFLFVITYAYFERTFWAIIFGDIVRATIASIGSYLVTKNKVGLSLVNIKEQWVYVKWLIPKSLLGFTRSQIDKVILSATLSIEDLGKYHLARSLVDLPGNNFLVPITEPLLAAFAKFKTNKVKLNFNFQVSHLMLSIITFPIVGLFYFFPSSIVTAILGDKWLEIVPCLPILSFLLVSWAGGRLIQIYCLALGKTRFIFFYNAFSFVVTLVVLLTLELRSLYDFSLAYVSVGLVLYFILINLIAKRHEIKKFKLLSLSIPPFMAVIIAGLCTQVIIPEKLPVALTLILSCVVFSLIYLAIIYMVFYFFCRTQLEHSYVRGLILSTFKKKRIEIPDIKQSKYGAK